MNVIELVFVPVEPVELVIEIEPVSFVVPEDVTKGDVPPMIETGWKIEVVPTVGAIIEVPATEVSPL